MRWWRTNLALDPEPSGTVDGVCPYCATSQLMRKHKLLPRWAGATLLFPSTELIVCPACARVSRDESVLNRIMSAVLLVPFLLLIAGGMAGGIYILAAMLVARDVSAAFLAIALILIGGGGYAGYRAARTFRRLLTPRRMLPMAGWGDPTPARFPLQCLPPGL